MSAEYDKFYLGSGLILKQAINKYGKTNFSNIILYRAETIEELNEAEIYYIDLYKKKFGKKLYNIANGGDGGNTLKYATATKKEAFKKKMSEINKKRCNTQEFKKKLSKATSARFSNLEERKKQLEKIKKVWKNEKLIEKQKNKLLNYYSTHKKDNSYVCKPCILELNNKIYTFDSRKELDSFF